MGQSTLINPEHTPHESFEIDKPSLDALLTQVARRTARRVLKSVAERLLTGLVEGSPDGVIRLSDVKLKLNVIPDNGDLYLHADGFGISFCDIQAIYDTNRGEVRFSATDSLVEPGENF